MADLLLKTVANVLGLDPESVSDQTSMQTCRVWDSLRHLQLVLVVEQTFNVRFSTEAIPKLISVDRIREEIARLTA